MSRRQGRHVGLRPRSPQGPSVRGDAMAAPSSQTPTIALGLIAAPGLATEFAGELAEDLPAALAEHVSAEVTWEVPVVSDSLASEATPGTAMIDAGRERMVREGWDLAVVLTDVPLRSRRSGRSSCDGGRVTRSRGSSAGRSVLAVLRGWRRARQSASSA